VRGFLWCARPGGTHSEEKVLYTGMRPRPSRWCGSRATCGLRPRCLPRRPGGYIVTCLDKLDPNINIEGGNVEGAAVDWASTLVQSTPTGTSYIDLPVDANGD